MSGLFRSTRERRLWGWAAGLLAVIYLSLYWVRPIAEGLRERNLLRLSVAVAFALVALAVLRWSLARSPGRREAAALALFALVYLAVGWQVRMPEERVHLLQYGLLGGLVYLALLERRRPGGPPRWAAGPALGASVISGLAGWLDEGIQKVLPNRHYDWFDVGLNLVAGALAVVALASVAEARRRDRRGPVISSTAGEKSPAAGE